MRAHRSFVLDLLLTMVGMSSGHVLAASPPASPSGQTQASPSAGDQPASTAFLTPEDAVRAYLAGVATASTTSILEASAIAEVAAGYRFDLMAQRLGAFSFPTDLAPAEYPFFADVDQARQTARILGQVQLLAYSLLSGEPIDDKPVVPVDKAHVEAFERSVDPARLSGLSVMDVRFPDATFAHNAKYLANAAAQRCRVWRGRADRAPRARFLRGQPVRSRVHARFATETTGRCWLRARPSPTPVVWAPPSRRRWRSSTARRREARCALR